MAFWNLRELIKASGGAGAAGQSFKTNVLGAAQGIKMSDYLIKNPVWTGQPLNPDEYPGGVGSFGTYADNTLLPVTLSLSVGAQAYRIQKTGIDAFFASFTPTTSGWGHSATIESVTVANNGGTLTANVRLKSAVTTTTMFATASAYGAVITSPVSGLRVQPVRWTAAPFGDPNGTTTFNLYMQYDPDNAGFNPFINQDGTGWKIRLANRIETVNDYEFQWFLNSSFTGTPYSTAAVIDGFGTTTNAYSYGFGPYPTDPYGSLGMETSSFWLRFRRKGEPTWLFPSVNPVSYIEQRLQIT